MNSLYLFIFCIIFFAHDIYAYCLGNMVSVGGICYDPNDGSNYCATGIECAERSSNGGCIKNRCDCVSGYGWILADLKCRAFNTNSKDCSSISECYDRTEGVALCNGKCACVSPSTWNSNLKICTRPNSGFYSCTSIDACQIKDTLVANCESGYCVCKNGYVWARDNCLTPNNEQMGCSNNDNCADNVNGYCDGTCKCNVDHVWDPITNQCLCDSGMYTNGLVDQLNTCENCIEGEYQPEIGQISCLSCNEGKYQNNIKSISCIPCPPHSTSNIKSTYCTCDDGYYFDFTLAPDYCPSNFY